jgi:hypothetical protein
MDLHFQIVFTVIGAFLSVVLPRVLIQNGKQIQMMHIDMRESFKQMDERTAKIAELISLEAEKTRELIQALKSTSS